MNRRLRKIYLWLLIAFILAGFLFFYYIEEGSPKERILSIAANLAELYGLIFLITEVFIIAIETEKVKKSIMDLQGYTDIANAINNTSLARDDISSNDFSRAILRLDIIKENYLNHLKESSIQDISSPERKNLDYVDSIINTLHFRSSISSTLKQDYIAFLTGFNSQLMMMKRNFKNEII